MKKKLIIFYIGFLIILFSVLSSAIEPCHDPYMRGDVDGNGIIDLSDAIFLLRYLYLGGESPICLEYGDSNGDKNIDLSDAIHLLNYLFQGGPVPGENDLKNIFDQGVNDPPELEFLYIDDTQSTERDAVIPEINVQGLPSTLYVMDQSSESDIISCEVNAFSASGEQYPTFSASWKIPHNFGIEPLSFVIGDNDGIQPNEDYRLSVSCTDINGQSDTAELDIKVSEEKEEPSPACNADRDVACAYYGKAGVEDNAILCLMDCDQYENEQNQKVDGSYEPKGRCNQIENILAGGTITKKGEWVEEDVSVYNTAPEDQKMGFVIEHICQPSDAKNQEKLALSINEETYQKRKDTLVEDSSKNENSFIPLSTQCFVESMTIIRKPRMVSDFTLPIIFLSEKEQKKASNIRDIQLAEAPDINHNNNIPLGPVEGWTRGTSIKKISSKQIELKGSYIIGYGFLVKAVLKEKSDPSSCYEGQFVQLQDFLGGSLPGSLIERSLIVGDLPDPSIVGPPLSFMYNDNQIRKKSLRELNLIDYEDVKANENPIILSATLNINNRITPVSLPPNIPVVDRNLVCLPGGLWCSDDYLKPRKGLYGGSFLGLSSWMADIKKHQRGYYTPAITVPTSQGIYTNPKIMWHDAPGYTMHLNSFYNPSSTFGNGFIRYSIDDSLFVKRINNFIAIVEDSAARPSLDRSNRADGSRQYYYYRWVCELGDLIFENSYDSNTKRRVKITEPSCECYRQKKLAEGGEFQTDTAPGSKITC